MKKLFFLLFIFLLPTYSYAASARLNADQVSLLNDAQDYLARVKTVHANFIQINPGSDVVSSGELFIEKPGRLKMSYSTPYRIDYYINDDDLTQYDSDLDEVTRGAAPDNPLKVLLYDDISLTRNDIMDVTNVVDEGATFSVYLLNKAQKLRDVNGLILKFQKSPIEISSVERVDYEGNKTETNLTAVKINEKLDDSLFMFKRPKAAFPNSRSRK